MGLRDALDRAADLAVDTAKAIDPDKLADAASDVARGAATAAKSIDLDQVGTAVKNAIGAAADSVDAHLGRDEASASSRHIKVTVERKGDDARSPIASQAEVIEAQVAEASGQKETVPDAEHRANTESPKEKAKEASKDNQGA